MRFFFILLFICSLKLYCQDIHFSNAIKSLGFGSCNRTDLDQKIWDVIANQSMNAWVWLGDIVYAEEENMEDLALKYSIQINGVTELNIMKSDVLSSIDKLYVCTSYNLDGKEIDFFPYDINSNKIVPNYKEFKGWDDDITQIKKST